MVGSFILTCSAPINQIPVQHSGPQSSVMAIIGIEFFVGDMLVLKTALVSVLSSPCRPNRRHRRIC